MIERDVRNKIGPLAGIFLGGTDSFKKTAGVWCRLTHEEGKSFHFARVSRRSWLELAVQIGADSVDSSQPLWSKDHWDRFVGWTTQRLLFTEDK